MFNDDRLYQYPPFNQHNPDPIWNRDSEYIVPVVSSVGNGPKGDKGDSIDFDDLTEEQIEYIRRMIVEFDVSLTTAEYVTSGTNTQSIIVPIQDFDNLDILFVDIEGLSLAEGYDYTLNNRTVVLATPITHPGTTVHFKALKYHVSD